MICRLKGRHDFTVRKTKKHYDLSTHHINPRLDILCPVLGRVRLRGDYCNCHGDVAREKLESILITQPNMNNETIPRKPRRARPLGETPCPHPDTGRGGDKPGDELRKGIATAITVAVCVPLLCLFVVLIFVIMLALAIPTIVNYILEN